MKCKQIFVSAVTQALNICCCEVKNYCMRGTFELNTSTVYTNWASSMMNCLSNNYIPADLTDNLSNIQGPGSQLWLGIIRHLAIYRTPESFQGIINVTQGYVETNKELTFATGSVQRQGLCENNPTAYSCNMLPPPPVQPITTTTSKTTLSKVESKVQKSSRTQSPVTPPDVRSEIVRTPKQRKDSTKQNQNDESTTVNSAFQESEDGKAKSAAVYAVIPVVIVLIAVGAIVFYLWRRKSLTKEKDDIIQPNVTVHDRQDSLHKVNLSAENPVGEDYFVLEPVSEYATIRESKIDKCQEEDYDTTHSCDDNIGKSHNIYNHLENEPEETYDHTCTTFSNEEDTYNHAVLSHEEELYDKTGESQVVHNDLEDQYSHIGKTAQNSSSQTNINPKLVSSEIDDTYNHVQR